MAKDIKQLNYTVEEINAGLQTALEHKDIALQYSENNNVVQLVCGTGENQKVLSSVQNLGSEEGGLTLRYIDEKTLRIYNTNGSKNMEDWTPVGDEIVIISADPDAVSYKFDFEPVSPIEPQIFVKETVDENPDKEAWQIQYKIKQLDNKNNIIYDPIEVQWIIQQGSNIREFKETIKYSINSIGTTYSFNWIDKIRKDTNFYKDGDYFVKARFIGTNGIYTNRNWSFSLTSLTFSSSFEEATIYQNELITIPYSLEGQMLKKVVGKIINKKTGEEVDLGIAEYPSESIAQAGNFTVKNLKHGVYGLKLECVGIIGSTEIKAPVVYKEFIFVEEGNVTPLIRWSYLEEKPLQQLVRTSFNYSIYNPANTLSNIEIELFSENNNTTQTRTITPNNTTHTWYYYPTTNSNGKKQEFSIKIKDTDVKVIKNLVIESFEGASNILEVTNAQFDFNPIGRTNFDLNRNEYLFNGVNCLSVSDDFDWANGGWVQENIGTTENPQIVDAFLIKAGSRMTLDYELFKTDIRNTGKNIKFIFKATNCQQMEAPVMTCKGENATGLIINSQNAKIYYRQNGQKPAIDLPYVEEEVVELEYNIEAENIQNSEQVYVSRGRKPLLVTYLSSDPSQAVICEPTPSTTLLGQGQWTQESPEKMQFGSDYCDVYLYRVKVYERELSDEHIMQNYYADAFDGPMGYQRYKDNNILTNGEIDIDKLKQKYPNLRILKIDCKDVWTHGKKDFKEVYVEHYYPAGRLKDNWKANAAVAIQGTSSVEYLTSAGNFDIDLSWATMGNVEKDDYLLPTRPIGMKYLVDGVYYSKEELLNPSNTDLASKISPEEVAELLETEYAMTDESIPIDYINVKVNIASSENANNARIAEWYNKYNAYKRRVITHNNKVRDTMEFHPCVIFLKENAGLDNREFDNDGNYHFYACGDFGNSKKNNHVFGMGEEAQYIVDELISDGVIQENEREDKIKEYQEKECIVEVSNNINDICRFKTAIFEDYQSSYDNEKQKVVVTDIWDGDAVEFRYKSNKNKAKEETLKLWKWLYSVDATNPGVNEIFISNVTKTILDNSINYSFDTPIPHTKDFTIKTITPNFMFNKTIVVNDKETTQTYSKCSVSKFVIEILGEKEEDYIQIAENIDGNYKVSITIPKEYLTYAEKDNWSPKFFVTFTSKNMLNWNQDNTFEITSVLDTADNRNTKFKEEYKNYFEEKSLLYFYLFTERFTMIDNRAKNTFIHFDGLKWNYCFDYDNDTALGCNNRGYLTMDYGVEDIDNADGYPLSTHGGDPAFNANDSVVWVSVRNNLLSELKRAYNTSALAWSASTMNQDFENYQGYKCNWLQMIDMRRKYLRPFTDGHGPSTKTKTYEEKYLPMLQGRKTLQRKRYQKYQEIYFESKYTSSTAGNEFTFRAAYKDIGPIIIPYIKCYPSIRWDDTGSSNQRTWGGEPYATPMRENENDLNFVIYPANYISAVKNLNNVGLKSASVSSGVKLTDVDLSDNPSLPSGDNSTLELSGKQTLLSNVNLRNTGAAIVPSLSELTSIKTLNTEDTQVTVISFADGGLIEEARLGALTEELSTINNTNLHTITIQQTEGKYNLKKIILNNPSVHINWVEFVDMEKCPLLTNLTILNIDYVKNSCWSFTDNSWIEKLYNKGKVTLTGHIYIGQIREHDYNKYLERWPGLTITYSGKFMPTYSVSYYNNYDPVNKEYLDFLFEEFYDKDSVAIKPSIIPTKPSDEHYVYTFKNWSVEEPGQPGFIAFNADTSTYAIYEKTDRKYKVTWYKDSTNKEELDTKYYSYGEEALYEDVDGKLGPRHVVEGFNEYYNLFKGWDQSTSYITEDIEVYGQWEKGDCSSITTVINNETEFVDGFDTKDLNAAQIYTLKMKNQLRSCFGARDEVGAVKPNFDRIKIPFGDRLNYNNLNSKRVPLKYVENGIEKELTFPCTFNKDKIIKTTNPLFNDISRGWTLFVDVQFVDINDMNRCLVSCFDEENSAGFKVCNSDDNYPMIQYNTAESKNGSSATNVTNRNTSGSFMREVFVLVHKPGETSIHTYSGMLDQLKPAYKELKCSNNTYIHNNVLQFGGYYDISEYPTHLAKGIVHNCILWNEVLGPSSCNQLVMWPHEDFEFTVVGFGRNKTASGESTKLDFLAAQSVWAILPGYAGDENSQTGFFDSYMYSWLSTRFLNSLPLTWRSILADTSVHTIVNDGTLRKETSKTAKIWLPAQNELFKSSDITEPWKSEASTMPLFTLGGGIDYNRAFAPGCPTKDVCPSLTSSCKWFYDSTEEPIDAPQGAIWKNNNRVYVKYFGFWMKLGWSLNSNDRPQSYYYYCRSSGSAKGTFKAWWSNEECQTYVATADNSGVNYIVPCFSI